MAIITIGGVGLPPPTSLRVGMQDLDSPDSTRNERGYLQRDRIRQGMYKIDLEFNVKTGREIALIESTLTGAALQVTFPDSGGMITKTMYVGDRTKEVILYNGGRDTRWSLNFNLVEY